MSGKRFCSRCEQWVVERGQHFCVKVGKTAVSAPVKNASPLPNKAASLLNKTSEPLLNALTNTERHSMPIAG